MRFDPLMIRRSTERFDFKIFHEEIRKFVLMWD
jgi:hypothetical protein